MKRKPLNEKRHRDARRAAGLTGCATCRDRGSITRGIGSPGRIGYYTTKLPCPDCGGASLMEFAQGFLASVKHIDDEQSKEGM